MVLEKIMAIIADKMDVELSVVNEGSTFDDLQVDSLAMVEIMLAIEDEFNISIDDAEGIETVADVAAYVTERIQK